MPIARLSDRYNRVVILSMAIMVWSVFTVLAGLATGFLTLALTRVGVAIDEFALTPAAHSIIASNVGATVREPPREMQSRLSPSPRGNIRSRMQHPVIRNIVIGGALLGFSAGDGALIASGAFAVGAISDLLTGWRAAHSLKWGLSAVSFVKAWSAFHYWRASRNLVA
ncbi:MAG: hypothetical protein SXG53_21545 [Pseudomonadota bacterium]|nr:hypothetical protein [Pseudomonadota bacterium]